MITWTNITQEALLSRKKLRRAHRLKSP